MRVRACWLECDGCHDEQVPHHLSTKMIKDAEAEGRSSGWLVGVMRRGRRVDLCPNCKGESE